MTSGPVILVVEDDTSIAESIGDLLSWAKYDVRFAADGLVAVEMLQQGLRPDLILFDLMMPRMDGYALRRELEKRADWSRIPSIVLTADRRASARRAEIGVPMLSKPFGAAELLEAVRAALNPHD